MGNVFEVRGGLVARNSILNLAGQAIPLLVAVAALPFIIRHLGVDAFGILSLAMMLLGYFSAFDFGLGRATTKYVAECLTPDRFEEVPSLVWTSVAVQILLGLVAAFVVAALVPLFANRVFTIPVSLRGEAEITFYMLAASLPILLVNNGFRAVLEAAQRFDLVNWVRVPASIAVYLLAVLVIPLGFHVPGIVFLWALSRLVTTVIYLFMCLGVFPALRRRFAFEWKTLRRLAAYGGWVTVSNTAGPLLSYLERFLIASVLSVGVLSYYSAPMDLVSRTTIVPASIAPALFPFFSHHGNRQNVLVSDASFRSCKYLMFIMTPIIAVLVFFAKDILGLWLGADFASKSSLVLQLLAICFFLNAFAYIPYTSVQALGRPDLKAILDVVQVPLFGVLAWWLISRMGIDGAAWAKLAVTLVDTVCLFWIARRLGVLSAESRYVDPLYRGMLASAALVFFVFLLKGLRLPLPVAASLLAAVCLGYAVAFWRVAVDGREREAFRSFSRYLLSRR